MTILENYLKSKKVQKTLSTKPGEEGFSLVELVVVIAVLAILSAVAIPAFVGVQANARASAVKNGLVNGVKECVVLASDNKETKFANAMSFKNETAFQGYKIKKTSVTANGVTTDVDSCYSAKAEANDNSVDSDFTIGMNAATGEITKTCSKSTLAGCNDDGSGGGTGTW